MSRYVRQPLDRRGPLRVMFITTSMPVGGAETLLVNLIRRLDRTRFAPELCCTKERGPLGEELAREIPTFDHLLSGKYDLRVLPRMIELFRLRQIDAIVTVGAGDKMFWGRLAAYMAGVPVIASAIHSTGWPDSINWLNRRLTSITDRFIGVADPHGKHLVEVEGFPPEKVVVIRNGIDTARFRPNAEARRKLRRELQISETAPVCGIVAALRPEKDHCLFVAAAAQVLETVPEARFLIVGDGPERPAIEAKCRELGVERQVLMLGSRSDIPEVLAACDLFALTSKNEASPVSILEAMSVELPIVAPRVGSIPQAVDEGANGLLYPASDLAAVAEAMRSLLSSPDRIRQMGKSAREKAIRYGSLETMVDGYETLIESIYSAKYPESAAISPHAGYPGNPASTA
ncbi:glycosyltransferase [Blastopirellula sp. JC732]|uniref:Glycosyltransferase n=1 Tax=Blastopirellula sediminis TaxID=2894196 RepID=A0A9X1MRS9_9BACT|nr:glycosyltransferase [Blastopirellula sediminis]MCC9605408.1 glycosyltransferase [Blastopirellula sediminis]MCC9631292.1 glycosyltransferase [Blastopirellula sediminis]